MGKSLLLYLILSLQLLVFYSCNKDKSCEECQENKPPVAIAGPDLVITLPTDSVSLDGSASSDTDGTISEWLWKKISGPASFQIVNPSTPKTVAKNLDTGVYRFELKVVDNENLSAADTIQITVTDPRQPNRPPVANAGADQTITLPTNTINLNGSGSTDPDNNIATYLWTKISGPSSFSITNVNAIQTQVTNLVEGVYQFELKVTDADALFSVDTVTVISQLSSPTISCQPGNRPIINLQLIPLGDIPDGRAGSAIVWADNKIFFAGGSDGGVNFSTVHIFNLTTQNWSATDLSLARTGISAVVCANKVFFAGGFTSSGPSSRVDIYDIATQSWSIAELSEPRIRISTATVGNKVFFAGGCSNTPFEWSGVSNKIDIYDLSTNTWSVKVLNETKIGFTATTAGSKIYFAGGWNLNPDVQNSTSANIDIYDDVTGTWSTSTLNVAKGFHMGIFKNGKLYWGGGGTYIDEPWVGSNVFTCQVETLDMNNQVTTFSNLSNPYIWFYNWNSAFGKFEKDDKIGFLNYDADSYYADIYNTTTNTWSLGVFNLEESVTMFISANNNVYCVGLQRIWKLEF